MSALPRRRTRRLELESLENRCQPALLTPGFSQLPLNFESNQGQFDPAIDFAAHGPGYSLALSAGNATLSLPRSDAAPALLRLTFPGAGAPSAGAGIDLLPGSVNYVDTDPAASLIGIRTFGKVEYQDLYPGIDLVYYGTQQQLEYDFLVAPGADPGRIALAFEGAEGLALEADGDLLVHTATGDVTQQAPRLYQDIGGVRHDVAGRFVLDGGDTVRFEVGAYDPSRPLVIDPVLSYVSYLGGNTSDEVNCVAVDDAGNLYLGGRTDSDAFPLNNPVPNSLPPTRTFVAKMDPTGSTLLYTTYLVNGGGPVDPVTDIAVDSSGQAYVVANAAILSSHATAGAAQTVYGGNGDVFVAKLNAAGTALVYATYIGGNQLDYGTGIAVDRNGNAFVTGWTDSPNFPRVNALQTAHPNAGTDAFVTKISPSGSQFLFSTYLGGNENGPGEDGATYTEAHAITLDAAGNPWITGWTEAADFVTVNPFQADKGFAQDAFVTGLQADGSAVLYSTFLSGPGQTASSGNAEDKAYDLVLDFAGNVLVTGTTTSTHFPVKNAFQGRNHGNRDTFVTKLNPQKAGMAQLVYSTYDGGNAEDDARAIAVDTAGNAYVTGQETSHYNFRRVAPFANAPYHGAFLFKLSPIGRALINSPFGSSYEIGNDIAVDGFGNVSIVGRSLSPRLRTTSNAYQRVMPGISDSGFVARMNGGRKVWTGVDQDGDRVTVWISGPGALNVVQSDPDGDGLGPIASIYLQRTSSALSTLTVGVTKVGDGLVPVGGVVGTGLLRLKASMADLVGAGVNLTGRLGVLYIHDVSGGAAVRAAGLVTQLTSIVAHDIATGTVIDVGCGLNLLKAHAVGAAAITAPRLTTLLVAADFSASVTLTGAGVALTTATVTGSMTNASIQAVAGTVSVLTAGGFVNSNVHAARLGRITLTTVQTNNGGTKFGLRATTSITSVRVTAPAFAFNPKLATPQGVEDFEVTIG